MADLVVTSKELNGTTPGMKWVILSNGMEGVWKPWNSKEFEAEQLYEKVSNFFGLPVSPCIKVEGGFVSIKSYNKRMSQIHAYDLDCDYSLSGFISVLPESVVEQLLLLLFVDAICGQADRHEGNLSFLRNSQGKIISICPVYDNCNSFGFSSETQSVFAPTSDKLWSHKEVYCWLIQNWRHSKVLHDMYVCVE